MSKPWIFGASTFLKAFRSNLNLNDTVSVLQGTDDPSSSAKDAPQGSIYMRTGGSGGSLWLKQDAGSSTNWTEAGAGFASSLGVRTISSSGNILTSDSVVLGDSTSGDITLTLPAASGATGQRVKIKKIDASNLVIIDGNSSETIDGLADFTLSSQYSYVEVVCDGTEWHVTDCQHFDYITQEITTATSTTTADTFVSTSQTMTLPCAGTWLVGYQIAAYLLESSGTLNNVFGRYELATNGDVAVNETIAIVGGGITGSQLMYYIISKQAVVTVAASTIYKIRIKCNENGAQGGAAVLSTSGTSGITDPDNRSFLWARRIK